jgi:phenylacetate-coenzyme A ligase PaaK-like adenylate-forming protein
MSTLTEPGERVLILLPGETPGSVGDLLRLGLARLGMEPIPYGVVRDPLHALETAHARQADCLVGSPTQVLGLARRWQPGMYRPRSVLLSTDYVSPAVAAALRQTWGCEVYNHYGATEMGLGGGVECAARRGYHLREADLLFEVVDPLTGENVADGEYGEVVVTTLTRRGMPLIRYRMGDRSRFIPGRCVCGTMLKTLETVRGRFSGFLKIGEQELRLPELDDALFTVPGVLNFSVTVSDSHPHVWVEARVLPGAGSRLQLEQTLSSISALHGLDYALEYIEDASEPGSIMKRTIIDKRGKNA